MSAEQQVKAWRVKGLTSDERLVLFYFSHRIGKQPRISAFDPKHLDRCCMTIARMQSVLMSLAAKGHVSLRAKDASIKAHPQVDKETEAELNQRMPHIFGGYTKSGVEESKAGNRDGASATREARESQD